MWNGLSGSILRPLSRGKEFGSDSGTNWVGAGKMFPCANSPTGSIDVESMKKAIQQLIILNALVRLFLRNEPIYFYPPKIKEPWLIFSIAMVSSHEKPMNIENPHGYAGLFLYELVACKKYGE